MTNVSTWFEPEDKGILIAYASIHGNTGKAAEKLAELLRAKGAEKVVVSDLAKNRYFFHLGKAVFHHLARHRRPTSVFNQTDGTLLEEIFQPANLC